MNWSLLRCTLAQRAMLVEAVLHAEVRQRVVLDLAEVGRVAGLSWLKKFL